MRLWSSHDLRGLSVIDARGVHVGVVREVQIDVETWQVAAFVVRIERAMAKELGMKVFLSAPDLLLKPERVHSVTDHVVLREGVADLARDLAPPEMPAP